ncbi:hypothetical protein VTN31DRAFT_492 [Thermomyces dupontii]|uniref:uncharacterized protein n=1 Tax=Talaromyces thermophilus TaxID=28565 RepID=UPI003744A786
MRLFRRRLGWLSTLTLFLLLVALLAGHVAAQNRDGGSRGNQPAASDDDSSDNTPANQPSNNQEEEEPADEPANDNPNADDDDDEGDSNNNQSDADDDDNQTDDKSDDSTDSNESETSTEDSSESESTEESTPTDDSKPPPLTEATSTSTTNTLPSLTSTSTSTSTSSFDIPVATVPPTKNAPYMKESDLPEGTVFIAVGAALGLVGLAVLAWRALVVWSINRSVRRAAIQHTKSDSKTALTGGGGKRKRRRSRRRSRRKTYGAEMSMEKLSRDRHTSHISSSSRNPATQSGLFYSPTAAPSGQQGAAGHRGSSYLPAGYYSAGSAGGPRTSHIGSQTPPASPSLPPSRGHDMPFNRASHFGGASTSSLNLNAPPQGRAPSAYLEDLFDSHGSARPNDFR